MVFNQLPAYTSRNELACTYEASLPVIEVKKLVSVL